MMLKKYMRGEGEMALALLRIDDRLIHGQIVTTWVKEVKATNILYKH